MKRTLNSLRPNPNNPRTDPKAEGFDELCASVRAQGVLQPLLIREDGLILAGHRRYAAAQHVGLESVPVRVLTEVGEGDLDLVCLIENLLRTDLTVAEIMTYLRSFQERYDMTPQEISVATGLGVQAIKNYLKLASAPEEIRTRVEDDRLSIGAAIALINAQDDELVAEILADGDISTPTVRDKIRNKREAQSICNYATVVKKELALHLETTKQMLKQRLSACPVENVGRRLYQSWMADVDDYQAQLQADNEQQLVEGAWEQGCRTEGDLSARTGLGRLDVRRIMMRLAREGLYYATKRKKTTEVARGTTEILWQKVGEPLGSDYAPAQAESRYESGDSARG